MSDLKYIIDTMYKGDRETLLKGISSKVQIIVANAVIAGTQQGLTDTVFVDELKKLVSNTEIILMGIPISNIAVAALDILGIIKYDGDDEYIQNLIISKLAF